MIAFTGPGTVGHRASREPIRPLLKLGRHQAKPFGDDVVRARPCKPQASFDLLAKITGIWHWNPARDLRPDRQNARGTPAFRASV